MTKHGMGPPVFITDGWAHADRQTDDILWHNRALHPALYRSKTFKAAVLLK